jgi:hypothetical protein
LVVASQEVEGYGLPSAALFCAGREVDGGSSRMDSPATYLSWNFILISVPNVLMIIGMVVVFVVALVAPFPSHDEAAEPGDSRDA